jgi:hypothetical protein
LIATGRHSTGWIRPAEIPMQAPTSVFRPAFTLSRFPGVHCGFTNTGMPHLPEHTQYREEPDPIPSWSVREAGYASKKTDCKLQIPDNKSSVFQFEIWNLKSEFLT